MNSSEYARIIKELKEMSETIKIETFPKKIIFSVNGDIGNG